MIVNALALLGAAVVGLGAAFVIYVSARFAGAAVEGAQRARQVQLEARAGAPLACGGATPAVAGRDAPRQLARVSDFIAGRTVPTPWAGTSAEA